MVAAEVSDERSAQMTQRHNNSRMITVGADIIGEELTKNIAKEFMNSQYDGGAPKLVSICQIKCVNKKGQINIYKF